MSSLVSLKALGLHVIDEIEQGMSLVLQEQVDAGVRLRSAEVCIAYATSDDSPASPAIVVGEVPLLPEEARRRIEALSGLVYVNLSTLEKTRASSIGKLILRLLFCPPPRHTDALHHEG